MTNYARNISRAFSASLEHSSITGNSDLFLLPNNGPNVIADSFSAEALRSLSPEEFFTGHPGTTLPSRTSTLSPSKYYSARNWNNNLRVIDDGTYQPPDEASAKFGGIGRSGEPIGSGKGLADEGSPEGDANIGTTEANADIDAIGDTEEILEAGEALEAASPWGIAAIINQQVGSVVNSAMTSQMQNQSTADYQANMNQHGVNVSLNSEMISKTQQQTIASKESAGAIGSLIGPIGTFIGRAVSGGASPNPSIYQTAASFSGRVDPTDTGIAGSASTADPSGISSMTDNID